MRRRPLTKRASVAIERAVRGAWRMARPCVDCPFNARGPGRRLRDSLRPGRWRAIVDAVGSGRSHFTCHKTTAETGDGSDRACAGAIAYQDRLGVTDNYRRVCERLAALRERRA